MPALYADLELLAPRLLASVVAFVAFFLIARVARARQPVAFAFAFVPLLVFHLVSAAAGQG
jgi:hypothetical protein